MSGPRRVGRGGNISLHLSAGHAVGNKLVFPVSIRGRRLNFSAVFEAHSSRLISLVFAKERQGFLAGVAFTARGQRQISFYVDPKESQQETPLSQADIAAVWRAAADSEKKMLTKIADSTTLHSRELEILEQGNAVAVLDPPPAFKQFFPASPHSGGWGGWSSGS